MHFQQPLLAAAATKIIDAIIIERKNDYQMANDGL